MSSQLGSKVCLLLIGSSRYRLLYGASNAVCQPSTTVNWSHSRSTHYQVVGGRRCGDHSRLDALGYFLHYGVAQDRYHLEGGFHGYKNHAHVDWNGPGMGTATDSPNSQLLIFEAVLRFRHEFRGCRHQAVFTSFAWDVLRRRNHFNTMKKKTWLDEFRTNFTTAVRTVASLIDTVVDIPFPMNSGDADTITTIRRVAQDLQLKTFDSTKLNISQALHQTGAESQRWWSAFDTQFLSPAHGA